MRMFIQYHFDIDLCSNQLSTSACANISCRPAKPLGRKQPCNTATTESYLHWRLFFVCNSSWLSCGTYTAYVNVWKRQYRWTGSDTTRSKHTSRWIQTTQPLCLEESKG